MQPLTLHRIFVLTIAVPAALLLAGCPSEYDAGFADGFAEDEDYWTGFDDSWDTVDAGPIYYQGSAIPQVADPPYDAGYWDGVWYAYNDGYFVAYDYAFTIGFSEGYAIAYTPDWPAFLASDEHIEYLDGGFTDGYNDGFSEGRVFGAWDYENGWPFDWLDAMLDYRDGTDLEIGGVATGVYGPVYLYEYGTDPLDLIGKTRAVNRNTDPARAIRVNAAAKTAKTDIPDLSYRDLSAQARTGLDKEPSTSPRGGEQNVPLDTTWLERIEAYRTAYGLD